MRQICYKCKEEIVGSPHEGLHSKCFCDWFGLSHPELFKSIKKEQTSAESSDWESIASSFFQGVFPKYSATLSSKSSKKKKYIIKVGEECTKELPAMEYLCNEIAVFLGIQVPKHFLIRFENKRDAFVCYNFMQDYRRADLVHVYRFLENPRDFTCEGLLKVLSQLRVKDSADRFVKLCLFDALIGNHDRHGRNLGIIQTYQGYDLSPFYDNPSIIAIENLLEANHHPTGAIAVSSTQEPSMKDYVEEFDRLGHFKIVEKFYHQLKRTSYKLYDLISNSFVSQGRKRAFRILVEKRFNELHKSVSDCSHKRNKK